jgi:hypothetical protein
VCATRSEHYTRRDSSSGNHNAGTDATNESREMDFAPGLEADCPEYCSGRSYGRVGIFVTPNGCRHGCDSLVCQRIEMNRHSINDVLPSVPGVPTRALVLECGIGTT